MLAAISVFTPGIVAQSISFHHINTSNGLSDNNVRCIAVDKNGFLWIGTTGGLNVYDGYTVTTWFKEQEKQLASNNLDHLVCDSRNRIWIGTAQGATWVDEKRKFHRVSLEDSISQYACTTIQETKTFGIVLYTSRGQYYYDSTFNKWSRLDWIPEKLNFNKFFDAEPFSADQIIYTMDSSVMILDYNTKRVVYEQPFFAPVSACKMSEEEIAVGIQTGWVQIINIKRKEIVKEYGLTNDQNGKQINTSLSEVRCASNGDLLVATGFAGLISINKAGVITRYVHDPLKPGSISANNTYRVLPVSNGDVIIGTNTSGVNTFNINNKQAGYTPVFSDISGNLFDNYLNHIVEDKNGILWIGAYDRVVRWDKKTDRASFYYYYMNTPHQGVRALEIRTLCFDKKGRLWVSALGEGIAVFNEGTKSFTKIKQDSSMGIATYSHYVHELMTASDGTIWASTNTGFFTIDPNTLKISSLENHPVLKEIASKRTIALFEDSARRMWIGVPGQGVYCYDKNAQKLKRYTPNEGLVSNTCYAFMQDKNGNIYAGSQLGFSIINPVTGNIRSYTRQNGLRYDRCEAFLEDDVGNIWIANNKCLIRFNLQRNNMAYFESNAGLSVYGFRFGCACKARDGQLIWGGQRGLNYFYTGQLVNNPAQLNVSIYQAAVQDSSTRFGNDYNITLPYVSNSVQFHFTAINLRGSSNIRYQYILEGYDKDWQTSDDIREARYTSLPAGKYIFKVKASLDMVHWAMSNNEVNITIVPPLWQRWWFILLMAVLLVAAVYLFLQGRNEKIKRQQEEIETEKAINYFASSIYEGHSVKAILWDVVKNCIGRLHFEDCVIYLLDHERKVLIQRAAHGPKSPISYEIVQPLEIPLGQGITGSVALTGKPELIPDTTKDPRYIVDMERRYSEITVPIISNDRVLGVIDCEHSKKGFFTQKHLSILTTIASLCANKIVKAKAEAEKAKTEAVLMETQKKMADVEMQALRAQMNPHFIFNCLNSINRYIVKSDQATASLYLTRFAKLIRLILDNSNSKNVTLSNELEALRLYIEMEALRFDKKFSYRIIVDDSVSADSVEVPPLIIQPYVENAIWHGLLHKESGGQLNIYVSMINDGMLQCIVEDDGVGREKAKGMKSKSATTRKSLGMKLTEDRISLLNKHAQLNASVDIIDLKTNDNEAAGTKVILKIPV